MIDDEMNWIEMTQDEIDQNNSKFGYGYAQRKSSLPTLGPSGKVVMLWDGTFYD